MQTSIKVECSDETVKLQYFSIGEQYCTAGKEIPKANYDFEWGKCIQVSDPTEVAYYKWTPWNVDKVHKFDYTSLATIMNVTIVSCALAFVSLIY